MTYSVLCLFIFTPKVTVLVPIASGLRRLTFLPPVSVPYTLSHTVNRSLLLKCKSDRAISYFKPFTLGQKSRLLSIRYKAFQTTAFASLSHTPTMTPHKAPRLTHDVLKHVLAEKTQFQKDRPSVPLSNLPAPHRSFLHRETMALSRPPVLSDNLDSLTQHARSHWDRNLPSNHDVPSPPTSRVLITIFNFCNRMSILNC